MAFQPGIAYGVAIATTLVLGCLAVRNRQAGWRKTRTNGVMDILMVWAQAQTETRQAENVSVQRPAITPISTPEFSNQLGSLMTALNVHAGATPIQPEARATAVERAPETSKR